MREKASREEGCSRTRPGAWVPQFVVNISTELSQVVAESGEWSDLLGSALLGVMASQEEWLTVVLVTSWRWKRTHLRRWVRLAPKRGGRR